MQMWIYVCMSACLYVCMFACMSLFDVFLIISRSVCLRPYLYCASRETDVSMYINICAHMLTCFQPYIQTSLNEMLWGSGHFIGLVTCIYCGCYTQPCIMQETRGASHVSQPVVQATPCCIATRHMMKLSTCPNACSTICTIKYVSLNSFPPNINRTTNTQQLMSAFLANWHGNEELKHTKDCALTFQDWHAGYSQELKNNGRPHVEINPSRVKVKLNACNAGSNERLWCRPMIWCRAYWSCYMPR